MNDLPGFVIAASLACQTAVGYVIIGIITIPVFFLVIYILYILIARRSDE